MKCITHAVGTRNIGYTTFRELEGTDDLGNLDYLNLCNKPKNTHVQTMVYQIINCKPVSIAFAIIIRVALQKYYKCSKLPTCTSGITERHNICLKPSIWLQNVGLYLYIMKER